MDYNQRWRQALSEEKINSLIEEAEESGTSYSLQLFIPRKTPFRPDETKIPPITNRLMKPGGGFWTSTLIKLDNNLFSSSWEEWLRWEMPEWINEDFQGYVYKISGNPKIVHIGNIKQYDEILQKYPLKLSDGYFSPYTKKPINFEKLYLDVDAVHYFDDLSSSMYAIDAESTCWNTWKYLMFVGVVNLRRDKVR